MLKKCDKMTPNGTNDTNDTNGTNGTPLYRVGIVFNTYDCVGRVLLFDGYCFRYLQGWE